MDYHKSLISVVIVTFNQEKCLRQCIQSLVQQSYGSLEIIIVNNGKSIDLYNRDLREIPLRVISNQRNNFYAGSLNQGIKASRGEFVLCLNDDVVLDRDFIREVLRGFRQDGNIGMVSGKVLSSYKKNVIDSTGLFLGRDRRPIDRGHGLLNKQEFEGEGFIFGVPGAVGIYRREMLDDISIDGDYFDSEYKIFYEDLDLCWRAQKKGWRAYYIPQARAYHIRGKTIKRFPPRIGILKRFQFPWLDRDLQVYLIRNRYSTMIKNDTLFNFLKDFIFILKFEMRLWGYIFLTRISLFSRLFKDISWLKSSLRKRKIISLSGRKN